MSVSMRERPLITGKDAEKLINRINTNSVNMKRAVEKIQMVANTKEKLQLNI